LTKLDNIGQHVSLHISQLTHVYASYYTDLVQLWHIIETKSTIWRRMKTIAYAFW